MDLCVCELLKESNKRKFDSCSVRNGVLIISHIALREWRVHIFPTTFLEIAVYLALGIYNLKQFRRRHIFIAELYWVWNDNIITLWREADCKNLVFISGGNWGNNSSDNKVRQHDRKRMFAALKRHFPLLT